MFGLDSQKIRVSRIKLAQNSIWAHPFWVETSSTKKKSRKFRFSGYLKCLDRSLFFCFQSHTIAQVKCFYERSGVTFDPIVNALNVLNSNIGKLQSTNHFMLALLTLMVRLFSGHYTIRCASHIYITLSMPVKLYI